MKSLLVVAVLLASITSQAQFIKSKYLYGASKRYSKMVDNSLDTILDMQYENHGKWVSEDRILKEATNIMGLIETTEIKVPSKFRWKTISQSLMGHDPYFCGNLIEDFWDSHDNMKKCEARTKTLLGKALDQADAVKLVHVYGDYYGDYEFYFLVLSDYETKETLTFQFDMYHEI